MRTFGKFAILCAAAIAAAAPAKEDAAAFSDEDDLPF